MVESKINVVVTLPCKKEEKKSLIKSPKSAWISSRPKYLLLLLWPRLLKNFVLLLYKKYIKLAILLIVLFAINRTKKDIYMVQFRNSEV